MAEDEARGTTGGWRWPLGPIRVLIIATALLSVVFLVVPQLDLWFSRQFYDAAIGFPALRIPALQWLRDVAGITLWAAGAVVVVSLLAKILVFPTRRPLVPARAMLFLSATLALSAGLVVNGILKSLWGRPRPTQVLDFGGDAPFVTAWHISDYCARNCSFVSGEASSAIWLIAIALVVPARFRRAALVTAIALAFAFSLNRIAFGGHFLSDVLIAWTLTLLIIVIAWHFLYVRPPRFFEEAAIDGALTRAGLWLRGLVARRKHEDAPLHPEAVAVLTGADLAVHARDHELPASPAGFRSIGPVFTDTVGPEEPLEPPLTERDGSDPAWTEDVHRDAEHPDVDQVPAAATDHRDALSEEPPIIPAETPSAPASPFDESVHREDSLVAVETPVATPPATDGESIESIDPEPDELPPAPTARVETAESALERALFGQVEAGSEGHAEPEPEPPADDPGARAANAVTVFPEHSEPSSVFPDDVADAPYAVPETAAPGSPADAAVISPADAAVISPAADYPAPESAPTVVGVPETPPAGNDEPAEPVAPSRPLELPPPDRT